MNEYAEVQAKEIKNKIIIRKLRTCTSRSVKKSE